MAKKTTLEEDVKKATQTEDVKKATSKKTAKKSPPVEKLEENRATEDDVYEIDLVDLLLTLWKRKLIIVAVTVAFGVCALAYILLAPKVYESRATVAILPVDTKNAPQSVALSPDTYLSLATAGDLLNEVIEEMSTDAQSKDVPSINALNSGFRVKFVESTDKNRRAQNPSAMIASYRSRNPETAMKVISAWSKLFVQKIGLLSTEKGGVTLESLERSLEAAKKDLETVENSLLAYQKDNPISLMEVQLKAKEEIFSKLMTQHATKSAELPTLEARAKAAANLLAKEPETKTVSRAMSNGALWNLAVHTSGKSAKVAPEQLNIRDEIENPIFTKLKEQSTNAEISAASDRVAIRDLASRIDKTQKEYAELNANILAAKTEIDRLSQEKTTLQKSYNALLEHYQQTRIASENTAVPLKVIENPVTPRKPVSRGGRKILCLATLLGLFVGTTLALLTEVIARRKITV